MYSSLHKLDILAELDGMRIVVQTDHRELDEIEAEPEISVLFALTRVLNAAGWLASEGTPGRVRYTLLGAAPPFLREALAAAGAWLAEGGGEPEELGAASPERAAALADRAFGALAARVLARLSTADPTEALKRLEGETQLSPPDREEDEIGFYRRVLELAALGGELIRIRAGGSWVQHDQALVPFAFRIEQGAVVFPTNRAERFVAGGGEESVLQLLAAVDDVLAARSGSRVMPSLRARERVPLERVAWTPLLDRDHEELPVVVYGEDGEATFAVYDRSSLPAALDELARQARENLAEEPAQVEKFTVEGLTVAAVGGGFYAAEKLLDPAFVRRMHRLLGAEVLAAAVPARGTLLFTDATQEADKIGLFAIVARRRFEDAGPQQISPAVVLVQDGAVVGFAAVEIASPVVGEG